MLIKDYIAAVQERVLGTLLLWVDKLSVIVLDSHDLNVLCLSIL